MSSTTMHMERTSTVKSLFVAPTAVDTREARKEGVDDGPRSQPFKIVEQKQRKSPAKVRNGSIDAGENIIDNIPLEMPSG